MRLLAAVRAARAGELRRALQEQQSAVRQLLDWTEQLERRTPSTERDGARAAAVDAMPRILEAEGASDQGLRFSEGPPSTVDSNLPSMVDEAGEAEAAPTVLAQGRQTSPPQNDAGDQGRGSTKDGASSTGRTTQKGALKVFPGSDEMSDESDEMNLSNVLEDFRRHLGNMGKAFDRTITNVTGRGVSKGSSNTRDRLGRIVHSIRFRALTTFVILLNAFMIGYEVDESLQRGYRHSESVHAVEVESQKVHWKALEFCFVVYFAVELLLRCAAERLMFLFGKEKMWNLFDTFLVLSSLVGIAMSEGGYTDFSFARILRLIRISRVLRILRAMRFSESLQVMVFSIMSSLLSLFWVLCLMFFVIYFFSILFLTAIIDAIAANPALDVDSLKPFYTSLVETVLYMFMSISGGIDWETMAGPLRELDSAYVVVFVGYVFFMTFGVLNVVVGIFVENAKQSQEKNRDIVTKTGLKQERENIKRMREIFMEADKDNDATLSWEEFHEYLQDSEVATFFGALGLDVSVARALFVLLDVDDSNAVNIDEFVQGCLRLKGSARSIDVNMLLYESEKLHHQLLEFMGSMENKFSQISRILKLPQGELALALNPTRKSRSPRLASILLTPEMGSSLSLPGSADMSA
ncbi:unnamed protein product [Prorocentrum cordatum]|uniref:EF-hand domain-containing protein n=1 Tax=Prorocentrum cordatum TaxID=2364126 RepID=A0ABN9UW81_9DINO|nr:unnamed protein product [Polarella glacialis]